MPGLHARLGPSAAHRWMVCPGSVRLSDTAASHESDSPYAQEGTWAHTRAGIDAELAFGLITKEQHAAALAEWEDEVPSDLHADMKIHAKQYVALIKSIIESKNSHCIVMIEQRVDTKVPGCWGTADCILVFPFLHLVVVVDYKYGMGVRVYADNNEQLMLYGIGAMEYAEHLADFDTVEVWIHQPRIDHIDSWSIPVKDLLAWREDEAIPMAEIALSHNGYIKPEAKACQFCPVSGNCKARMKQATDSDFGNPDLLTPEEMSVALNSLAGIERWCKDVRSVALRQIFAENVEIPGWKVVKAGGKRTITDPDAAISLLVDRGFDEDEVSRRSPATLAQLEKAVGGAKRLQTLLGGLLIKTEGRESLAPDKDNRESVDSLGEAAKDFSDR